MAVADDRGVGEHRLSLAEWVLLCLVREEPTYGLDLAGLLARDGSLGQIWSVPKATVYRALERLESLGLIQTTGKQRTSHGPPRWVCEITPAGRGLAQAWLSMPVAHCRDVRSELMVKLALHDRTGADWRPLVHAQLARLLPVAAALEDRLPATRGFEHTMVLWRRDAMTATVRFLTALTLGCRYERGLSGRRHRAADGAAGTQAVPAAAGRHGRRDQAGGLRRRVGPLRSFAAGRSRHGQRAGHDG
jgi:DNA-binding PadR family transcriptional regulator